VNDTMRAVQSHTDEPGGLVLETVRTPVPAAGEVLVAVFATAVTADELTWAEKRPVIPSHEVAGVVAALGDGVTELQVGDEVYGLIAFDRPGAAAEYVAVPAGMLAAKPAGVDHPAAAAVPLAGLTAWQALVDHGEVRPGQRVLVHGGAGGVGCYAVQLAVYFGAIVIATASAADAGFVADLGAHTVLDYADQFEDSVDGVDLVIDTVGGETLARSWSVLRPGGMLVGIAEPPPDGQAEAHGLRSAYFVVEPDQPRLVELARLIETGAVRPQVGRVFPLANPVAAFTARHDPEHRGKVIIEVRPTGDATSA
jgi:NADPH:quinone reductase-like Zn-dependent oxidoreductase